jgi:hypothetical protein
MKGKAGLFVACSIGVCSGAAAAQLAAPPAGYKIEAKYTQKSPDGATTLDQRPGTRQYRGRRCRRLLRAG